MTPQHRELAGMLLSGMTPGAILEEMEEGEARSRAAALFQRESGAQEGQELRVVGDCLRILHKKRIEEQIAALQQQVVLLKGEDKRNMLLKIQELTKERQTAGRKD